MTTVVAGPPEHVAVVGSGASGVLTAVQFLNRGTTRVTLLERRHLGGAAYRTDADHHLLNVRAGQMSGLPDDADDFLTFVRSIGEPAHADDFVPRRLFRAYLERLLHETMASTGGTSVLEQRFADVTDLTFDLGRARIELDEGSPLTADQVVLAVGNPAPAPLAAFAPAGRHPGMIGDPWLPRRLGALAPTDAVVIVGTALTGADVALDLVANGHTGPITMVGRRGKLPLAHCESTCPTVDLALPESPNLAAVSRAVQTALQSARAHDRCWHGVIDGLRPQTQQLWQGFSSADKDRFLRTVRPWWDRHRHRMAPAAASQLRALVADGRVGVEAGSIAAVHLAAGGLKVALDTPAGPRALTAQAVINCTGPATVAQRRDGLLPRLLARGAVRSDLWGLGVDTDDDGRVIDGAGVASTWLSAVGPLRRGTLWESTAIPEIRVQAAALARRVAAGAPMTVTA